MECVVGGDPGASGCLTAITRSRQVYTFIFNGKNWREAYVWVASLLLTYVARCIMFESVGGRKTETKMTKPQLFVFGKNTGIMEAMFIFQGYRQFDYIEPQPWQRYHNVAGRVAPLTATDAEDYKARKELYRKTAELRIGRPVKLNEGDSILIAIYAWEQTFGERF